MFYALSS